MHKDAYIIIGVIILIGFITFISWYTFNSANHLNYVKENAEHRWQEMGFEVVGYDGYQWGFTIPFTDYGGAKVWHILKKSNCTNEKCVTYSGYLQRWGDEIHMYNIRAIDAIRPQ